MESPDLKSNSPDDAQLEGLLRAHSTLPPLRDDGFSARVVAALPPAVTPRAAAATSPVRGWLIGAAALLGVVVAARPGGSGAAAPGAADQLEAFFAAIQPALAPLADPSVLLALLVSAISLAFVYRRMLWAKLVAK